jgi:hypothetical protein
MLAPSHVFVRWFVCVLRFVSPLYVLSCVGPFIFGLSGPRCTLLGLVVLLADVWVGWQFFLSVRFVGPTCRCLFVVCICCGRSVIVTFPSPLLVPLLPVQTKAVVADGARRGRCRRGERRRRRRRWKAVSVGGGERPRRRWRAVSVAAGVGGRWASPRVLEGGERRHLRWRAVSVAACIGGRWASPLVLGIIISPA